MGTALHIIMCYWVFVLLRVCIFVFLTPEKKPLNMAEADQEYGTHLICTSASVELYYVTTAQVEASQS